jgi:predicted MPP superfamily phosphohydrolase
VGPDTTFNGYYDAFVAKVNPSGTALVYSGFLGGSDWDYGGGIAVDSSGNAYVTGGTGSSDFPAVVGPDTSYNGGGDTFVLKVNPDGTAFVYSGFLGGSDWDVGSGIAVDPFGTAYVTGVTISSDFPVVVGPGKSFNGYKDAFVVKLSAGSPLGQGYIRGQVKDASTGKVVQGAKVEASGPTTSSTTTDSNGNYTLTLPPGTYTLTASASGYQSQTKTGITVATGKTTTVDFALSPLAQLGCIKGRVTDAVSRQGLKGAKVEAKGPITASTTTDSDGSYSLPLPPGRYSVTASIPNFYQLLTKTNVNVVKGRDTKLDFALTPIKPQLAFNATTYICGETITLTVTDRAYAGATEIAGPNVLVLKDSKGTLIASWNRVPALSNASDKFAITYRLPNSIKQGKITATYTDPTYPGRKAEATANFTLTWSFAILTDLHIGRWYPGPYDGSEYFLTERLRKALRDIKKMNTPSNPIKFVVVLGDLSESGEKAQLQKVRKIFEEELGNLPWIPIMGNHDVWARSNKEPHFAEVFSDYLDQLCNNPIFGGTFRTQNYMVDPSDPTDLENYVFECGGIRFICLDFNTREPLPKPLSGPGADAVLYPTTYAWLAENLSPGQPAVLFSHHPFKWDLFLAFSPPELDSINELIRQSGADVKATFAGHIHGFDGWTEWIEWLPGKQAWFSANEKKYPPLLGKIPVVTTEALMVGQNQPGVNKAVVRIVKVTENFSLSYNNFAGKYNAYNPKFEYEQEFFYIEFEADCFTKLPVNKKTDYIWDFGRLGIKKGKEVKLTKKELSRLGSGEVTLDVKLTVKGESISYRIKVNVDSLHFFPASCETITMRAVPNPVQDVHTTVFTALGAEAEEIKVEVYDLTGRLVWKGEAEGNELPWDTRDLTGLPLANGVYLYLVYVKVEGEWIVSDVQKLVILR